jgi:hypothetical protein
MNETRPSQKTGATYAAYIVAILFAIRLPTFFIPVIRDATPTSSIFLDELNGLLGVAPHLLLFPVVAALPAPRWAKAAGYGWLAIDISTVSWASMVYPH